MFRPVFTQALGKKEPQLSICHLPFTAIIQVHDWVRTTKIELISSINIINTNSEVFEEPVEFTFKIVIKLGVTAM